MDEKDLEEKIKDENIIDYETKNVTELKALCREKDIVGYGLSPVKGVPVAGWLDYGLPTESSK